MVMSLIIQKNKRKIDLKMTQEIIRIFLVLHMK